MDPQCGNVKWFKSPKLLIVDSSNNASYVQLHLPVYAEHAAKGPGYLGLVADSANNKSRPLFLNKCQADALVSGSAGNKRNTWSCGTDQSLKELIVIGGEAVPSAVCDSLDAHIRGTSARFPGLEFVGIPKGLCLLSCSHVVTVS